MKQLSDELRSDIIFSVSKTGGHLGSSLGVVELTVALHYVFNTPEDKFLWDVGHQVNSCMHTYIHPSIKIRIPGCMFILYIINTNMCIHTMCPYIHPYMPLILYFHVLYHYHMGCILRIWMRVRWPFFN